MRFICFDNIFLILKIANKDCLKQHLKDLTGALLKFFFFSVHPVFWWICDQPVIYDDRVVRILSQSLNCRSHFAFTLFTEKSLFFASSY